MLFPDISYCFFSVLLLPGISCYSLVLHVAYWFSWGSLVLSVDPWYFLSLVCHIAPRYFLLLHGLPYWFRLFNTSLFHFLFLPSLSCGYLIIPVIFCCVLVVPVAPWYFLLFLNNSFFSPSSSVISFYGYFLLLLCISCCSLVCTFAPWYLLFISSTSCYILLLIFPFAPLYFLLLSLKLLLVCWYNLVLPGPTCLALTKFYWSLSFHCFKFYPSGFSLTLN